MIEINQSLIIQIVNFLIFIFILNELIFKPVVRVMNQRRERIEGTMERAGLMGKEAQEKFEAYERRISEAKTQAAGEKERLRRHGETLSKEIVEKARAELARDIPIIRRQIAEERDRVRRELDRKAQDMAREIACRILGREIS
ncbi:MAG: ATP synthase F0 subunit B [Deltaproteobacteria bacterium]|nr:ATP synthase F0 subunit B [Deltaproteobacteria bacterium]